MMTTPFVPTPERGRDYPCVGHWPVLARLPDVSEYLPPAARDSDRSRANRTLNYRFDPPEKPGGARSDRDAPTSAIWSQSQLAARPAEHRSPQPHLFHQSGRDPRAPVSRGESPILPRSDPFSFPESTLGDALAPLVRFVVLVALFTVAGTIVLTIGKRKQTPIENAAPNTTAIQQQLEPAPTTNRVTSLTETTPEAPTAAGPREAAPSLHLEPWPDATVSTSDGPAVLSPTFDNAGRHAARESAEAPTDVAPRDADLPWRPVIGPEGSAVPQVRTSDPPPAVARLQGTIRQVPTRQANNDDDQSSLH